LGTKNDYGYGFAVFLFTLVLTGFHSAFHLGSRGKFGLGDAVLAGLLSIVLLGFAMLAFALETAISWGEAVSIFFPLVVLGAFAGYRLHKYACAHSRLWFLQKHVL
jgi:hypothetical protein